MPDVPTLCAACVYRPIYTVIRCLSAVGHGLTPAGLYLVGRIFLVAKKPSLYMALPQCRAVYKQLPMQWLACLSHIHH